MADAEAAARPAAQRIWTQTAQSPEALMEIEAMDDTGIDDMAASTLALARKIEELADYAHGIRCDDPRAMPLLGFEPGMKSMLDAAEQLHGAVAYCEHMLRQIPVNK